MLIFRCTHFHCFVKINQYRACNETLESGLFCQVCTERNKDLRNKIDRLQESHGFGYSIVSLFFFFILAPPKNEDLPDLDMLMGTLEGGESELETTASPPPLVLPEEKHAKQRRIEELKQGLANEPIDLYDEDFEKRMEEEILMVGNISLEMVQVQLV